VTTAAGDERPSQDSGETTRLLERVRAGDAEAAEAVYERLYADMRRIAERLLRSQRRDHTLAPTALVHEAYIKMAGAESEKHWADSVHALAVAARAMRQILSNYAREKKAEKRGGAEPRERLTLAGVAGSDGDAEVDLVAFDEALERLSALDERQGRIAELRILGGLDVAQVATLLGVSTRTVELDWRMAKQALRSWLAPDATKEGSS
jgi:RNA polymerase sigma factor (TIGR02999 family)